MLSIQQLQTSGTAVTVHCRDSRLEESGDAARIQQSATTTGLPLDESGAVATIQEPAITTGHGGTETAPAQGEQSQSFVPRGTNRHHCGQRRCDCLCHLKGKKAGRFWFVEYTPLSILMRKPENGRCGSRQFCLHFRLALSNYGIPFAIIAGLNITKDAIRPFALQSALWPERIAKYTSPGFETICRLEHGNISLGEAQTRFGELYRSDPRLEDHRDPSGHSYV